MKNGDDGYLQDHFFNGFKCFCFWLLGEAERVKQNSKEVGFASNEGLSHWSFGIYKELGFADGCGSGYHLGLLCLERSTINLIYLFFHKGKMLLLKLKCLLLIIMEFGCLLQKWSIINVVGSQSRRHGLLSSVNATNLTLALWWRSDCEFSGFMELQSCKQWYPLLIKEKDLKSRRSS